MNPTPELSEASWQRIEAILRDARVQLISGAEALFLKQLDATLLRSRDTLFQGADAALREQTATLVAAFRQMLTDAIRELRTQDLEPLLAESGAMLARVSDEIIRTHAAPLFTQMSASLRQALEEGLQRQMQPVLAQAREHMKESADLAAQFADATVRRLQVTVGQPAGQFVRRELPGYAHWTGRRLLDYGLATTFLCLAAIFLMVGGVLALQHAGVPNFATFLIGGLVALGGGLVFLRVFQRNLPAVPHEVHSLDNSQK